MSAIVEQVISCYSIVFRGSYYSMDLHLHKGPRHLHHPRVRFIAVLPISITLPAGNVAICFSAEANKCCVCSWGVVLNCLTLVSCGGLAPLEEPLMVYPAGNTLSIRYWPCASAWCGRALYRTVICQAPYWQHLFMASGNHKILKDHISIPIWAMWSFVCIDTFGLLKGLGQKCHGFIFRNLMIFSKMSPVLLHHESAFYPLG